MIFGVKFCRLQKCCRCCGEQLQKGVSSWTFGGQEEGRGRERVEGLETESVIYSRVNYYIIKYFEVCFDHLTTEERESDCISSFFCGVTTW